MEPIRSIRPPSIVAFERLYLASTVLYVLTALIFWSATRELMAQSTQVQSAPQMAGMIGPIMIGSFVLTVGLSVLFWWLVARARSVVGKWLVVVTEAIGAVSGLLALLRLVRGTVDNVPQTALALFVTALAVAAMVMLFRSDADAWFTEAEADEEPLP